MAATLPAFALYPQVSWRQRLSSQDWDSLCSAWISLIQVYLGKDQQLKNNEEDTAVSFVASFVYETAAAARASSSSPPQPPALLSRATFRLIQQLLVFSKSEELLSFKFLAAFSKIYPKKLVSPVLAQLFITQPNILELSLSSLKKTLIPHLDAGIKGDLKLVEKHLTELNPMLHASPDACMLFLAGSDFFDGLVTGYKVMNPPLRKVIIATMYLCLIGLIEAEPPKWAMLSDQLFSLKAAADTHKQGPLNVNDSLVPELVTSTPILRALLQRIEDSDDAATRNLKKRITALEPFKKGAMIRPKSLIRRRVDKGKTRQTEQEAQVDIHVHLLSQITQVQDLFPDLGAGFIAKCLDEYGDDVEQVVANLLSESLPPHLASADRSEALYVFFFFSFSVEEVPFKLIMYV